MYRIEYLPSALRDLTDIACYIGVKLQNPDAADRLAEKIVAAVDELSDMPYRYEVYIPVKPLKYEYRKMIVDNYLIFYRVDENKHTVIIFRVIYGGRQIEKLLN